MKQTYDQNRFSGFHFSLPAKEINRLAYGVAQPKVTLFIEDLQVQQQQSGKRGKGGKNGGKNGKTCVYTLSENPFETRKLAQELNIDINKDCKRTI